MKKLKEGKGLRVLSWAECARQIGLGGALTLSTEVSLLSVGPGTSLNTNAQKSSAGTVVMFLRFHLRYIISTTYLKWHLLQIATLPLKCCLVKAKKYFLV